jgi:hypothetical protein
LAAYFFLVAFTMGCTRRVRQLMANSLSVWGLQEGCHHARGGGRERGKKRTHHLIVTAHDPPGVTPPQR